VSRADPSELTVDVGETALGALRWGDPAAPTVVAVHGITANAWCWAAVARHLAGDVTLVAIDLRGRGRSNQAPGPCGMRGHADDVAAVIDSLGGRPRTVVGHSMGTWVALMTADRHPSAVDRLVLVDGGVSLPVPDRLTPDEAIDALLGPAIDRLRQVFPDRDAYRRFWMGHPAFRDRITPDIDRWLMADLEPVEGGYRSRTREGAVRTDGAELLLDEEVRTAIDRVTEPATMIRAERGLFDEPSPLVPAEAVDHYPQHEWITVPGTNHYDVLVGDAGAAVIADAIRAGVAG
jgi:pimeloyl-ACP methyl ester carboxylesterase